MEYARGFDEGRSGADARIQQKHQALLNQYLALQKDYVAKKKKLEAAKKKKEALLIEVSLVMVMISSEMIGLVEGSFMIISDMNRRIDMALLVVRVLEHQRVAQNGGAPRIVGDLTPAIKHMKPRGLFESRIRDYRTTDNEILIMFVCKLPCILEREAEVPVAKSSSTDGKRTDPTPQVSRFRGGTQRYVFQLSSTINCKFILSE
ncbi:hypothetical protein AKJ16_DCAP21650 [Drosera capensis]